MAYPNHRRQNNLLDSDEMDTTPPPSSDKSADTNISDERIASMDVGPEEDDDNRSSVTSIYECGTLKTFYDDESQFYPNRRGNQRWETVQG